MDEQVRTELCALIATSGPSVCNTPRLLTLLLRQCCPEATEQVRELGLALEVGCVQEFLDAAGPVDLPALVDRLMADSGLSADRARWVIATWRDAINENPGTSEQSLMPDWSRWNRLDVSGETA